jgi:hypothetical protein
MKPYRALCGMAALYAATFVLPAQAQFFFSPHDMTAPPITGTEPKFTTDFPGATPAEVRAALVWQMRAALNVAALQCQFEPTLLSVPNYNAVLFNHKDEIKKSYDAVTKYFIRTNKTAKAGQTAFDHFDTRNYSAFTAVDAQYGFCQTAAGVAVRAAMAPRGQFYKVALEETGTLRNSLVYWGDQRFPRYPVSMSAVGLPNLDPRCIDKKGRWLVKACGPEGSARSATSVASR